MCKSMAVRSYTLPEVRGSDRECQAMTAQEQRPRGASPRLRSRVTAERNYPTSEVRAAAEKGYHKPEVRGGGREKLPHLQEAAAAWAQED